MNSQKRFGAVLGAILLLSMSSACALGQNDAVDGRLLTDNREGSPPLPSETAADPSQDADSGNAGLAQMESPRWTASAEAMIWNRIGTVSETLVSIYPVAPPPKPMSLLIVGQGTDQLYSDNLTQGFVAGTRVGLTRHADNGCDWEISFFEIDGWNSFRSIASAAYVTPVFVAPGGFVQTTDNATQDMGWDYATRLLNAELNLRWDLCARVTMLAGFRWVNLSEELQGTIKPSHRKWPFWDNKTRNNLYGLQLGEDWKIFNCGSFSMDGLVKAGLFGNVADETTEVSIFQSPYWESATANHLAFLGEIGLQCKYQVTQRLSLKIGYEAMCLQGVALAPGQIPETESHITMSGKLLPLASVQALGVNSGSGAFYQGATAGLEYAF